MLLEDNKILFVIFGIMLMVPLSMIGLFVIFNTRKNKLIQQRKEAEIRFESEMIQSQIEIREETLKNISWELHDNIGQLVTLAKIYLQNSEGDPEKINESIEIIGKALNEVRALSRSINPESIGKMGLIDSVINEMERFKRMKFIKTDFQIIGESFEIPDKEEVIIFRILQEFFSNTIKHARATELNLKFIYDENLFNIICKDNGIGFEHNDDNNGIGLKNMKNRSKIIEAKLNILSKVGEGTELNLEKEYK